MAEKHFYQQIEHTKNYLLGYFKKHIPDFQSLKILEIGCAEAGFVHYLDSMNIDVQGLELAEARVNIALGKNPHLKLTVGDITKSEVVEKLNAKFDLIVMRDVIEHIPQRREMFENIVKLLNPGGYLYVTFPPRFSAFAGHQQNGKSILKFVPYVQLLPDFLIRTLGNIFKEHRYMIETIINNFRDGLTIGKFVKYCNSFGFDFLVKELFLIRPIYKIKFSLPPVKMPWIPALGEFLATGCECLLQKK